jgi:Ni/Co efflux regulator RcnB
MKRILSIAVLASAPAVLTAAVQSPSRPDAAQTTSDSARSQSGRSTSHDRHARKHRTTNHHHRPRTTAKGHSH